MGHAKEWSRCDLCFFYTAGPCCRFNHQQSDSSPNERSGLEKCMTAKRSLVSVVDDDAFVREALPDLLKELGYSSQAFPSAAAFLSSSAVADTRCLILDVAMPHMTGPELHRELIRRRQAIPVIFVTA